MDSAELRAGCCPPTMSLMRMPRLPIAICLALLISTALAAKDKNKDKKKDEDVQSSLSFTVLKDDNGKPIRNAAVILHPVGQHDKQLATGFELKTNGEGETSFDGVPYGTLRVQVIARGFQTFGQDYEINQPEHQITIRLKRPQPQYSIYEKHDNAGGTGNTQPKDKAQ